MDILDVLYILYLIRDSNLFTAYPFVRLEGNKSSGDSSSSSSSSPISNEDDGVQQQQQHSVKSDRNSWTTATVQSTFSVETSVAGSVDSYSMISTTSETDQAEPHARSSSSSSSSTSQSEPLPIDSFLTPASSSICSQQDYEILKASLFSFFSSSVYYKKRASNKEEIRQHASSYWLPMAGLPSWMDGCFYPSPRREEKVSAV